MPHTHTYKAVSCTQKHRSCAHDNIEKIYTIYNTPPGSCSSSFPTSLGKAGHGERNRESKTLVLLRQERKRGQEREEAEKREEQGSPE